MKLFQHILSALSLTILIASCSQELDVDNGKGYLSLSITSLVSTQDPNETRATAPEGYDAKMLHVEIRDAGGVVIKSTDDFVSDKTFQENIQLQAGTYTVVAHSANWDGSGSGFDTPFYYGSTTIDINPGTLVKASVVCTQDNVKLTVNYDLSVVRSFGSAVTTITSALIDVAPLQFIMGETMLSGYIPVGDFEAAIELVNESGNSYLITRSFTNVKARDHYILNIKLREEGYLGDAAHGGIKVEVDESTNTYTYTLQLAEKSDVSLEALNPNAWSTFAWLKSSIISKNSDFQNEKLQFQWREVGAVDWYEMPNEVLTVNGSDEVSATLKGLDPNTNYEYRLCYVEEENVIASNTMRFTTEEQINLYNGGFEHWWMSGKVAYPNEQGVSFWDTSNPGGASFGGSNTTETTEVVHSGSSAAKLESQYIVIKFAAASMYTGSFGELVGTSGAWLNWGMPFVARPTALKGYMQYAPVAINRVGKNLPLDAPAKGEMDQCGMYCALLSETLIVDNTDMSTFPDWENDPRVIAYGSLPVEQNVHSEGQWKEVNIPLVYRDLNSKPTHVLVVFSASKYGDYFHGGEGSTLYVDDFSLEYGENPIVK